MDELEQALAKLREAGALGRSMADYTKAEEMLGAPDTRRILIEVVGTLAKISQLHNDAATLIVQHLESLD